MYLLLILSSPDDSLSLFVSSLADLVRVKESGTVVTVSATNTATCLDDDELSERERLRVRGARLSGMVVTVFGT